MNEADVAAAFPSLRLDPPHPGAGGFKQSFFAVDSAGRRIVLKIYRKPIAPAADLDDDSAEELMTDDELERVRRELSVLSSIRHPNVIELLDGPATVTLGGATYLCYREPRLVRILGDEIDSAPWPPDAIRRLLIDLLRGAKELHENDRIHRDIKPDNIGFREDGSAVLLDFGAAFFVDLDRVTRTNQMAPMTRPYAAPEQFDPTVLPEPRIDLYQIGLTTYQFAAGEHPFLGRETVDVAIYLDRMKVGADMAPVIAAGHGEDVVAVLERLLQYRRHLRFRNAERALAALEIR